MACEIRQLRAAVRTKGRSETVKLQEEEGEERQGLVLKRDMEPGH
jgi:hypothetical protein